MHNINMMASPGTDAFLRETMPRQYNMDPIDSPTLEFVDPGSESYHESRMDEMEMEMETQGINRQYASGFSKLV